MLADVHASFTEQVRVRPDALAARSPTGQASYAELAHMAERAAQYLAPKAANTPSPIIAVHLDRSIECLAVLLGILQLGGAFLPLDPGYPRVRLRDMLADARPAILVTSSHGDADVAPHGQAVAYVEDIFLGMALSPDAPEAAIQRDAAYVIYTSGSTGRPKGVVCTHAGLMNRLLWMRDAFSVGAGDRILQKTPLSFDVSVWETFLPLICGATVVLAPPQAHLNVKTLAALISDESISITHLMPSMLQDLLDRGLATHFATLRHVFCGGEVLPSRTATAFRAQSQAGLHNIYGPTEATIGVTCWSASDAATQQVTLGRPLPNVRIRILGDDGMPVPAGESGEIHIGGIQLAKGYLNRPDLTAERYVQDPLLDGERLYRTGDVGRWSPTGELVFIGRKDHQVKHRGYRIELGEIEQVLLEEAGVALAAVLLHEVAGTTMLAAYVASPHPPDRMALALRRALGARLPHFMQPATIQVSATLPLAPNGKVDRGALSPPTPQPEPLAQHGATAPSSPHAWLLRLWRETLVCPGLREDTDFFAAGGTSLAAATLVAAMREVTHLPLDVRHLFQAPTVREFAARLERGQAGFSTSTLVPLKTAAEGIPLFCAHPAGGTVFRYKALAEHLPANVPVYGLQARGLGPQERPDTSVAEMAARHMHAIRARQPEGPYRLLGWSFGGLLAVEIAHRLQREGEAVSLLAMLDTPLPIARAPALTDDYIARALAAQLLPVSDYLRLREKLDNLDALLQTLKTLRLCGPTFGEAELQRSAEVVRHCIQAGRDYSPPTLEIDMFYVHATHPMPGMSLPTHAFDWQPQFPHRTIHRLALPCTHLELGQPALGSDIARYILPWLSVGTA